MPLDPLVKAFLDQMSAIPSPKMWMLPPSQAREVFKTSMRLSGPKDVPVGKIENISIPGPGGPLRLRLYKPVAAGGEALPVLVYFHGGGFVIGDLDTHDGLCRMFVDEGEFAVIAVDYRLAPEHVDPAAADDAYAALVWIEQNASDLGIDANRIAVGGDSAGGHITAVVTHLAKEKGAPKIAYQLLLFPSTQFGDQTVSRQQFSIGYFLDKQTLDWFASKLLPPGVNASSPLISPLHAREFSGLPPAYIMLGGYDPLHDEGLQYANRLKEAGVQVFVDDYSDMVHCFIYMQTILPQAHEAVKKAARAVRAALV
jgi:acetyl esterase